MIFEGTKKSIFFGLGLTRAGRGMPDVSLLQPLCDALGISLNELFSGEHISAEEYKGKAEENISKLYKEKQIANLKPIKYLFSTCSNVTLLVAVIELAVGFIGNFFDFSG